MYQLWGLSVACLDGIYARGVGEGVGCRARTTLPYAACAAVVLCVQCGRARAAPARPHRLSVQYIAMYSTALPR